ncbi:hypothetical protein R1flu_010567 [Riccia fluitans]|uniref:CBF1-interacting co-repressor CIR N-terminal domain-containing protein n=1 Tax=Riccia fluitans TaxID=41844 RepID=A0ABD1Z640_9MARC
MGGHGGLNILPQKRWNVYNFENREKVKRDEEEAAREELLVSDAELARELGLFLIPAMLKLKSIVPMVYTVTASRHITQPSEKPFLTIPLLFFFADGAEQKTLKSSKSKKSVEDLRVERLAREQQETDKARKVLLAKAGSSCTDGYGRRSDGRVPHYHASFGNAR